MPTWLSW